MLLAFGFGVRPITMDLNVMCILASPSEGSPLIVSYYGISGSGIENLWLLPAFTISNRRPFVPVSQVTA